jgi:urease accessory protein
LHGDPFHLEEEVMTCDMRSPEIANAVLPRYRGHTAHGMARLEVDLVAGQSAVTSAWAVSPLKLLTPRSRGLSVWAYLSSFGGGMVAGDQNTLTVRLGAATRAFVSTQSSTKIYRSPSSQACTFNLDATLGPGAVLALVPDAVQCFAGSIYEQRQEFHLHQDASLVIVDWVCSGRAARGERWTFTRFKSRTNVFLDGERVLLESLLLDPQENDVSTMMGRYNCFALVLVLGGQVKAYADEMLATIAADPIKRRSPLAFSASPIPDGALLRIAGESMEAVSSEIQRRLCFLKLVLSDDPWTRKW